jgi:NAD(P)-dependent dehydrogenase (short-subunit alcohol dehydrogenase family)
MAWSIADIPDLSGRVAVVTGANGGLGLESTKALAGAGAHVVMAVRDEDKARRALEEIRSAYRGASLEIVELDLASFDSCKAAAAAITERHRKVDILLNNAGLMALPERRTADGYEMQFGVNHLGHWILTAGLLPSLIAAPRARVVTVTSTAHHYGRPVDPHDVNLTGRYSPWIAYGRAKLANYHFGLGLQAEFARHRLAAESLIAHPGLSDTNLQTHTMEQGGGGRAGQLFLWLARHTGMSSAEGALPQLRAATDPRARGGEFYGPRFVNNGPPVRRPILRAGNASAIEKLWQVSERETGVRLDVDVARREA